MLNYLNEVRKLSEESGSRSLTAFSKIEPMRKGNDTLRLADKGRNS
ncbi:MAG: hypothetical protein M1327_04295 [Candidatus Thermoplasmatota archaeon]|nr:hypothetical protein [Candidatus Thermoplasmatota archaeon]